MTRVLSVLPEAGGNVLPTLEILRELAGRGHEVTVLGHRQVGPAVGSAGLRFRPFVRARPWSAVVENPGGSDGLNWPRRDARSWPHLVFRSTVVTVVVGPTGLCLGGC